MKSANIKALLNSDNYQSSIEAILKKCTRKTQVKFALHCAEGLEKYYNFDKYPEVKKTRDKCFELVANWLFDAKSVSKEKLGASTTAARAAGAASYAAASSYAASAASYAASAAAYAAYAANAASAASYAASAAASSYAASAASYAAGAASAAAGNNYDESVMQNSLKDLFFYLVKLYLTETDTSFKAETFNLLYLTESKLK